MAGVRVTSFEELYRVAGNVEVGVGVRELIVTRGG
jgi:hypothetical protein